MAAKIVYLTKWSIFLENVGNVELNENALYAGFRTLTAKIMGIQLFTPQDFQRSTVMFLDRKSDVSINNHPNWVPLQPNGKKAYDHPPKSIIFRTARSAFQIPHDRGNTTRKFRISCDFNDDISENDCAFSRKYLRTSYRHHRMKLRANENFWAPNFSFFTMAIER